MSQLSAAHSQYLFLLLLPFPTSQFGTLSHILPFGPVRDGWDFISQPRKGDGIIAGTPRNTSVFFPALAISSCTGE